jgi:hypothetical protein
MPISNVHLRKIKILFNVLSHIKKFTCRLCCLKNGFAALKLRKEILLKTPDLLSFSAPRSLYLVGREAGLFKDCGRSILIKVPGCALFCKILFFVLLIPSLATAQFNSGIIYFEEGRLTYVSDSEGNRIPDFSHAGYRGGVVNLPDVPVRETISPVQGDNRAQIQNAINRVANLTPDENGIRGAVKLEPGIYNINSSLQINHSGVVLIGSGDGDDPSEDTIIRVSRNVRDFVIQLGDERTSWTRINGSEVDIISDFLPVGSRSFEVENTSGFSTGDRIILLHPATNAWIDAVDGGGTEGAPAWEPDPMLEIIYNRQITAIRDNVITIDAPIFNHFDRNLSQPFIYKFDDSNLVTEAGIENIRIDIQTVGENANNHTELGVYFYGAANSWARNVTVTNFQRSGFKTHRAFNITVENSSALEPHSPITGTNRYNFNAHLFSNNILFKNVLSTNGRRDFVANGSASASGIVFHNSKSVRTSNSSEGHRRWSHGLLYDNITFENATYYNVLSLYNRGDFGSSQGWASAHSVAWNTDAEGYHIYIQKPPTAQNYGIGNKATVSGSGWFDHPRGYIEGTGRNPDPASLYLAQLQERLNFGVAPDAPTRLSVSNDIPNQLELTWNHVAHERVDFEVERSPVDDQNFEKIALIRGETSFKDQSLGDQTYLYRVRAVGEGGKSAYSPAAENTPRFDESAISGFSLLAPDDGNIVMVKPDADDEVVFSWEEESNPLKIFYNVLIDLPGGNFTSPVEILDATDSAFASFHFSRAEQLFERFEVQFGDTLEIQWTVNAKFSSFEKRSEDVNQMKLVRDYPDDVISDFRLNQPVDDTELIIDSEKDDDIRFTWDETSSIFDVSYSLFIDLSGADFSAPVKVVESLESASLSLHFSEATELFRRMNVAEGDTLNAQWTVKANSGPFELWAEEVRQIKLVRKPSVPEGQSARLDQNYPNPFDPATTIQYYLSEPGQVRVEVFDIQANRVALLEEGHRETGFHTIHFNGSGLAGGVYLYRLTVGNFSETRKMILIR